MPTVMRRIVLADDQVPPNPSALVATQIQTVTHPMDEESMIGEILEVPLVVNCTAVIGVLVYRNGVRQPFTQPLLYLPNLGKLHFTRLSLSAMRIGDELSCDVFY